MSVEEEAAAEVKVAASEALKRPTGPFWGAVLISFVVWNWQACLYLVYPEGDWKVRDRIEWLKLNVYNRPDQNEWYLLWLPLIFGLLSFSVFPWILKFPAWLRYYAHISIGNDMKNLNELTNENRLKYDLLHAQYMERGTTIDQANRDIADLRRRLEAAAQEADGALREHMLEIHHVLKNDQKMMVALKRARSGDEFGLDSGRKKLMLILGLLDENNQLTDKGRRLLDLS